MYPQSKHYMGDKKIRYTLADFFDTVSITEDGMFGCESYYSLRLDVGRCFAVQRALRGDCGDIRIVKLL